MAMIIGTTKLCSSCNLQLHIKCPLLNKLWFALHSAKFRSQSLDPCGSLGPHTEPVVKLVVPEMTAIVSFHHGTFLDDLSSGLFPL